MAEHDLSKIVDGEGEIFNIKDAGAVHTVDSALSSSSTNPVQNKVVKTALDGKADKVSNATANNFAGLDANGNLKDSGKKESDFASASHTHSAADITSGTLPIARGGTGQTTAKNIVNETIQAGLDDGGSNVSDATDIITSHSSGYSTTNKGLYRRKATCLWNYIKGKLTSVSGVNISGSATSIASNVIPYHRPTDSTGDTADGKQWCRLATLTDTAVVNGGQWFGIGVLFNLYCNPYGPGRAHFGCYEFSFKIGIAARAEGAAAYSLKTSGTTAIEKLYGPDAPAAANGRSGIDFRIVKDDTTVELFIKNSVWDSSLYVEKFREIDGSGSCGTWAWNVQNGLYTDAEFDTYCTDKTVINLTKKFDFRANTADKPGVTLLTSSNNLNDIKGDNIGDVLWYRWTSSSLPTNAPVTGESAEMQVVRANSVNYCVQIVHASTYQDAYYRICSNGTWSSWYTYSKSTHTHGNITNGGALQTNDITIASGDKLVVTDSSDSNKVARTSVSFDGSTTTTALTPKGTFEAFFKSNTGTTTLQSGTAVKVGTQNGADVKLQLPTIPAAANNGALKIGLNGGTATSKFTANQSGDSTLTFASGTAVGTIKVDGTDVPVNGAQTGLVDFYDITVTSSTNTVSAETYAAIAASITAGRMVFLRNNGNPIYRYLDTTGDKLWFYSPFEELAINTSANNDATHTFTVAPKADASLNGLSENSIQNKAVKTALDAKANASDVTTLSTNVTTLSNNVAAHTTLFHSEVLDVTDGNARFLKISFSGRVGRCIAIIIISNGASYTSAAFRLSWDYINSTNGISDLGKEIFSCSDLSKPPLVYKDNDNFYIGIYDSSLNRSATVSVMMTSEDSSKVSFGTVTRAVATASDKTAVPLTWHAVMSETVNEIVMGYVGTDSKTLYIV